jgi:NAD(P)-dependent dehydrogenase (short-subunit alcohol dehydrogenase family)
VSQPSDRLDGQIALVTGGGRGIGANIARELAAAGARVAVAARTREQVEEVAREIGGLALEVDVTDREAVERMAAEVERELGPIDLLQRGRGRVVITGSGAGYLPGSTNTAYSASKAAVNRLAETLAESLRETPVRVFLFSPGLVQTEMTSGFSDDAPWTPPELAPRLVHVLASGRADELAGRYLHAEHDDIEELIGRADEIRRDDLNAVRLRR